MSESEVCPTCNRFTQEGLYARALAYQNDPIFGTNLKRPISAILEEARNLVYKARNIMDDLKLGYPGMEKRAGEIAGTLTVLMVYLHHEVQALKEVEKENKDA